MYTKLEILEYSYTVSITNLWSLFFLFQRKFQIETEVENWIQRYDQDMGERQVITTCFIQIIIQDTIMNTNSKLLYTVHKQPFLTADCLEMVSVALLFVMV